MTHQSRTDRVVTGEGPRADRWTVNAWRVLHIGVAITAVCLLWAVSVPGFVFLLMLGVVFLLAVAGLGWVVLVGFFVAERRRWSWRFLTAPVIVVLTAALLVAGAPFQARWAMSRGAFDRVIAALPAAGPEDAEWSPVPVPHRIGAYFITSAYAVPGGVVLYETNGSMLDDAGFAYLPQGPTADLATEEFEAPRFKHLGGPWYSWTASW
ncbi:hypothetical protein [Micromonospora sp. C28ISP2-4]|uniref:hypothetical protein n=1 Tax=Micromonospora sp. C28ISP2-4 TaxID=3059523 RepID=UPI00267585FD|nr:hypothetical protein [Micromonospora sp. C28ISP2-4]MDO3686201.1 hypothetical protein [Micromonospora sp. C28ISP2-4]